MQVLQKRGSNCLINLIRYVSFNWAIHSYTMNNPVWVPLHCKEWGSYFLHNMDCPSQGKVPFKGWLPFSMCYRSLQILTIIMCSTDHKRSNTGKSHSKFKVTFFHMKRPQIDWIASSPLHLNLCVLFRATCNFLLCHVKSNSDDVTISYDVHCQVMSQHHMMS